MGVPKHKEGTFTYSDYLQWPDEERWELIHGIAYNMSPAPSKTHQRIVGEMFRRLANITDTRPCDTLIAPFDVRLFTGSPDEADELVETVVQPDISVFCDPEKIDERGGKGAPDLVVEVLSPATAHKDQTEKLKLYDEAGVREYWIVNAEAAYIMVYRRGASGVFGKPDYYTREESVKSEVLDASIALSPIFGG
ncbi:MAG: Uma2 family endonuclease [Spirochaetaceae bacterium]